MQDVRKGDTVIVHGRALIDGRTKCEATVTGVGDGDRVSVSIDRGNGQNFDVPGPAQYGETSDGSTWWEWPESGRPERAVDDVAPAG